MGKKSSDDDAKRKKHKKSDVETDHASSSKSLKSVQSFYMINMYKKGVLKPCSESKVKLKKKQKKRKEKSEETKEMMKCMKDLTEAIKKLQETLQTKPDLLEGEKDAQEKEDEEDMEDTCCFDCEEAEGDNDHTIFVKGFQNLRPRNEIKRLLSRAFGKCGGIKRVFVPIECKTRLPLGFAFINFENNEKANIEKALKLNGCILEGRKLEVTMATDTEEYYGFTEFNGCERCCKPCSGCIGDTGDSFLSDFYPTPEYYC